MRNKKGISLIVLVITIIVMVILAAAVVITLSNTGIINKANEAVEKTNIKEVEQLASLTWAEEFMEGKRGDALKESVLTKLKDYTDKYEIIVTDTGVTVTEKNGKKLNEYGFYYDTPYKMETSEGTPYYLVFKPNNMVEAYSEYNMKLKSSKLWEYEINKLVSSGSSSHDGEHIVSNDGKTITLVGSDYEIKYNYTDDEYRDVYYEKPYYYTEYSESNPYVLKIEKDNTLNFYDNGVLVAKIPGENITKNSHILEVSNSEGIKEEINEYGSVWEISMDGRWIQMKSINYLGPWVQLNDNEMFVVGHSGSNCFFKICKFEQDMTWEEWINSSYNTIGAFVQGNEIIFKCCNEHNEAPLTFRRSIINKTDKLNLGMVTMYSNEK